MSSTTSSTTPDENKAISTAEPSGFPTTFEGASELIWLPYRTMFHFLSRNHSSTLQMLNFHRKCGDDLREIVRTQQDLFLNLSERFLNQLSGIGTETGSSELGKSLDQLQDTTLATMREIGEAVVAAQASSFEAIKQQMHLDQSEGPNGHHTRETAH